MAENDLLKTLGSMIQGVGNLDTSKETKAVMKSMSDFTKDLGSGAKDLAKNFSAVKTAISSGKITDIAKAMDSTIGTINKSFGSMASAFLKAADGIFAGLLNLEKYMLTKTKQAMGGLDGTVAAFGSMIQDSMNLAAKATGIQSFSAVGGMVNEILQTSMSAFNVFFKVNLSRQQARYAAMAQTGGGATGEARGALAVSTVTDLFGKGFSLDEAKQWGDAVSKQGAALTTNLAENVTKIGLTMGMSPGEMSSTLDKFLVLESDAEKAGKMMVSSFTAARVAAEQSGIPAGKLQQNIMTAAVNARFLNVDLQTVSNTMLMLTKNQDKFKAAGVSIREDGAKILEDLSGGSKKFSDAMFAFFGTKGGTEGSPIAGLIKAKMGTTFATSLQETAGGGFSAQAGTSGDMMVQRLDMMKSTMIDAAKSASTKEEKLYAQMKVATDVFGMSEETAKVLAMGGKDDLKKLAENPKLADQFKTTGQLLGDLKSLQSVNEKIQIQMASLASEQVKNLIAVATNTAISAAQAAGVNLKDLGLEGSAKDALAESIKSSAKTLQVMSKITGGVVNSVSGGEFSKLLGALQTIQYRIGGGAEYMGGYVSAWGGKNVYNVGERGPELFVSGNKQFFIPSESGVIRNTSETMGLLGKGQGESGVISKSQEKMGDQKIMHLTINAGMLDKSGFKHLLENEVLGALYD
jgi:hypothetical protein